MNAITFENVFFQYPATDGRVAMPLFQNLNLSIEEGSFVAVLGRNGSGKSTLARLCNGIELPTKGKVTVFGMDTTDEARLLDIHRSVGMVFQNPDNQLVANVVEEDVAFAPENLGIAPAEIRQRVDAALKQVGMYEYRTHAPHLLSGGQKQRIAIAGILAMHPRCIVLDEPTAMLDPRGRQEVLSIVTDLCRKEGLTLILITHHMSEAALADRVVVLSQGKILTDGTPKQVLSQPAFLRQAGLCPPQTVALLDALRHNGFPVPLDALSPEDCAKVIFDCGGSQVDPNS